MRTVPDDLAGKRLDQALAAMYPDLSRNRLQQWIRDGRVLVDGEAGAPKRKVRGGELLQVDTEPAVEATAFEPEPIALTIVYEDEAILVIDKPAGLVVHPGSGNWHGTLLNGLLHYQATLAAVPRAGIVHRLDKETSGLMVVAKTLAAQTHLVRQLQARSVSREYVALVHGRVAGGGAVDAPIGRHPTVRTRMAVVPGGREAVTHYQPERRFAECTLVACRLETGRTHQIRVHMAHIGHPLVGDPVYGRRRCANAVLQAFERQALHARRLGLIHPVSGEALEWNAPIPRDFHALLVAVEAGEVANGA
nr:23S rRNA pseudouridine(1911/1915/1917) synthase RluD [Nitrogeniibacter mangrovi]